MDLIVCVKHVPETAEAELKINASSKDIEKSGLVFDINEYDNYALEEAVRIKEKFGGTVTAITVGPEESDNTLRKCLAHGADKAIRITDQKFIGLDAYATAKILFSVIRNMHFDLILTGVQATDDCSAAVGPILAEFLGIPHATLVKKIEFSDGKCIVTRELEAGLAEQLEVELPALFTIQTGINEPRYISITRIRQAVQKEIKVLRLENLDLNGWEIGEVCSWLKTKEIYVPPVEKQVEFLKGTPDEIVAKIIEILRLRGIV